MTPRVAFGATPLGGGRHPGTVLSLSKGGSSVSLETTFSHTHLCIAAKELHHG
jgi:hypothetical protein